MTPAKPDARSQAQRDNRRAARCMEPPFRVCRSRSLSMQTRDSPAGTWFISRSAL